MAVVAFIGVDPVVVVVDLGRGWILVVVVVSGAVVELLVVFLDAAVPVTTVGPNWKRKWRKKIAIFHGN